MLYSISRLYTPDAPALAFIILLSSGGSNGDVINSAIRLRKNCLDPANIAVIVIQVDNDTTINHDLASKPDFFFVYPNSPNIGTDVTNALTNVTTYDIDKYTCERVAPDTTPSTGACSTSTTTAIEYKSVP